MSRYHSYINSAAIIIDQYKGQEPLAVFLKQFFAANKKYGSKDRKQIGSLCYHFYRVAHALEIAGISEQLLAATLLCEQAFSSVLAELRPAWNEHISGNIVDKTAMLDGHFDAAKIFPFISHLSAGMDGVAFVVSFLEQPHFFLRARPGFEKVVPAKLKALGISFEQMNEYCLSLANGTKLDEEIAIDKEVVVQDYNSQQVGIVIKPYLSATGNAVTLWDCCAASGGKSIMLFDMNRNIKFTVSDIRSSILHNLSNRFQKAGLQHYQSFVADLAINGAQLSASQKFNIIVADVPCTGSGTWARTPEQLYFFRKELIAVYTLRQQQIVDHVIPHIANGGLLFYITCSVFKEENEEMIFYIKKKHGLELAEMKLLPGYELHADTMFVAVLKKL
ncbi:MAG: Fmu (Sun) domain-containing protein [Chitinophagaceae bacterium]